MDRAVASRERAFSANGTAAVAIPIIYGSDVVGALAAYDQRRARFFDADAETLEAFGQYVALARSNHAKVRRLVNTLGWERRTSWILTVVAILSCLALAAYGYVFTRSTHIRVLQNARIAADTSNDHLDRYVASGTQLAATAATLAPSFRGNKPATERLLRKLLSSTPNDVIYGVGIWYLPYKFSPNVRLFGPYVHRTSNGKMTLTYKWSHPDYNYVKHAWYRIGLNARAQTLVTQPYFDTDHVYISAVHEIHIGGNSIGVVSVDTTSESIDKFLTHVSTARNVPYLTTHSGYVVGFPYASALLNFARSRHPAKMILDVTDADAQAFIAMRFPGDRVTVRTRAARIPVNLVNSFDATTLGSSPPPILLLTIVAVLIWLLTLAAIWAMRRARARGLAELDLHRERTRLALEINAHVTAEHALRKAAEVDPLTGLLNRTTILAAIDQSIQRAKSGQTPECLLFIDLNGFERINSMFGHLAGDKILADFAGLVRSCSGGKHLSARLGGDEFAVLVRSDAPAARRIGECVQRAMEPGLAIDGEAVYIDAGIGVVEIAGSYGGAEDVVRDADYALRQAKRAHRTNVVTFDPALREEAAKQRELQAALRGAVARGEIFVEYQPICRIRNGELVAFEALVRWHRASQPVMYPTDFIPLAERTGLVFQVDRYVADVACAQMARWQREYPQLRLELNASALHFEHPGALRGLTNVLQKHPLHPETVDIELTESSLVGLTPEAMSAVRDLHSRGIRLHLDDFGTGYSSLSYLQRLHVDALKIDKSFVDAMLEDKRAMQIVTAIVNLARSVQVDVIAEGVTTPDQARALEKLGVTMGQGFLYAHPMPATEAERMLIRHGEVSNHR
jgi:diguanylate cyclase (GGDEF)-like protein